MALGKDIPPCPKILKHHTYSNNPKTDYKESKEDHETMEDVIDEIYLNKPEQVKWTDPVVVKWMNDALGNSKTIYTASKVQKGLIVYGMAIHTVTDLFAHGTYRVVPKENKDGKMDYKYVRIKHPEADDVLSKSGVERYEAAYKVVHNMLQSIFQNGQNYGTGSIRDFEIERDTEDKRWYGDTFKLGNFYKYVREVIQSGDPCLLHDYVPTGLSMVKLRYLGYDIEIQYGEH